MLKIKTTVFLALTVFAAFSAVAVPSASAAEFIPSSGVTLTGKNTGTELGKKPTLTAGSNVVTCTEDNISASITGAMEVSKINITYKGCKSGSITCQSGGVSGEIKTKELKAVLGLGMNGIEIPPVGTVGLLFSAVSGSLAEFKCSIVAVTATGRFFCAITPLNIKVSQLTSTCKATGSTPEYPLYLLKNGEGLEEVALTAFGMKAALMSEDALTPEGGGGFIVEVKS